MPHLFISCEFKFNCDDFATLPFTVECSQL